jgi:hypothetical protein
MKRWLFVGLVSLLISCTTPELSTPAPTPVPIQVIFPPSLKPWADKISACASQNPLVALYYNPPSMLDPNSPPNSVVLQLGESFERDDHSYLLLIGWEQIDIIINQERDLFQLTSSDLQSVFSGLTNSWEGNTGQPIEVWVFPDDDTVRKYFDKAVLQSNPLTSEARLAPDPDAMLQAVSKNPNAIGYLPGSFLSTGDPSLVSSVRIIPVDRSVQNELKQPVIAITQNEPVGELRELLVCVQTIDP